MVLQISIQLNAQKLGQLYIKCQIKLTFYFHGQGGGSQFTPSPFLRWSFFSPRGNITRPEEKYFSLLSPKSSKHVYCFCWQIEVWTHETKYKWGVGNIHPTLSELKLATCSDHRFHYIIRSDWRTGSHWKHWAFSSMKSNMVIDLKFLDFKCTGLF